MLYFVTLHVNMHHFCTKVSKGLAVMVLTEQVSESFFPVLKTRVLPTEHCTLRSLGSHFGDVEAFVCGQNSAANPKIFFRLNNSLHLFETLCTFLPLLALILTFFIGCKSYEI